MLASGVMLEEVGFLIHGVRVIWIGLLIVGGGFSGRDGDGVFLAAEMEEEGGFETAADGDEGGDPVGGVLAA